MDSIIYGLAPGLAHNTVRRYHAWRTYMFRDWLPKSRARTRWGVQWSDVLQLRWQYEHEADPTGRRAYFTGD